MINIPRNVMVLLGAGCLSFCPAAAAAPEDGVPGVYVDFGQALFHRGANTDSLTFGVVLPWTHQPPVPGDILSSISFYWDIFVSQWRALRTEGVEERSYTQVGVIANWRYFFNRGDSPWFVEAGIGGTVMDRLYRTSDREFSTAFQFTEQFGIGRSFGVQGEQELSLRVQHFSNGGIKAPNPGETFVRVRYLHRF